VRVVFGIGSLEPIVSWLQQLPVGNLRFAKTGGYTMTDYATLLRDHVTLKCRSIDRIFLQAYVPKLQSVGQVCIFLRWQRKFKIPSSAAFGKIGKAYVIAIHDFAEKEQIPVVEFKKGENKEEKARPYIEAAAREGKERVVMIGIAPEKASAWHSWPAKGHERG
jgi:hypothetical protein